MLLAIANTARPDHTGWADEEPLCRLAYPTLPSIRHARHRLKKLVGQGVLERQRTRPPRHVSVVTLTPTGSAYLAALYRRRGRQAPPATRPPRLDQSVHHLLVVASAIEVLLVREGHFVRLWGDEDLRSQVRRGRSLAPGQEDVHLPDGRLFFRPVDTDRAVKADIEILVSKYTDAQIRRKYELLAPARTLFFAPTARLCARTAELVGAMPFLLA